MQGGCGDLGEPDSRDSGINMFGSLGERVHKRNLSDHGVESSNFKEYRQVSIAVEALLQRGPDAPEPSDEANERLVSRGPDTYMEPEQKKCESAGALAKAGDCGGERFVERAWGEAARDHGSAMKFFSARRSWCVVASID